MHSKFVGHSTEIIQQSKIKGPLHRILVKVRQERKRGQKKVLKKNVAPVLKSNRAFIPRVLRFMILQIAEFSVSVVNILCLVLVTLLHAGAAEAAENWVGKTFKI